MSTIKTTNITHGSNSGTANMVLASDGKVTIPEKKLYCPGAVVQVIFASKTDVGGAYSTLAWSDTGLSAAITPTSSSSKILIQAKPNLSWDNGTSKVACALFKGSESDPLLRADAAGDRLRAHQGWYMPQNSYQGVPFALDYLDSPNTTSSTTYKVRVSALDNTGSIYMNRGTDYDTDATNHFRGVSTIILMEIAG